MAADAGVDDVQLIAALALHRRMHEFELRHALGDRVYDAFEPRGLLYQHDAEDPDNLAFLGTTDQGEEIEINKRAAESRPARLRQHQPRRHGRRVEVDRRRSRQLPLAPPPSQPDHHGGVALVHGPACVRAPQEHVAYGQGDARPRPQGVPDRDDAQHRHVPPAVRVPLEARVGVERQGPCALPRHRQVARRRRHRDSPARSSTASRHHTR